MKKVKLLVFLVLSLCFSIFIASAEEANAADMHRLYNPNSGEHFYTANGNEKNHLVKVGWKYEGIGWTAPATGNAVYRLYNANAGDHHYTQNANEKNHLVKVGWKYEGIGWYSDVKKAVPLYRAYNPNAKAGSHNYTVNYAEQKNLIRVGWRDEGIAWYGINKSTPVTKYTVTVKHVGSDGKTLNTSSASVEKGKSYTAKAGSFSGYTLKGSNSQTVTVNGNKTITFNYTKNATPVTKYTVTVKHVGSDGKELKKTTATIEKGKNYTAKAETFNGYTLKGSNSQTVTVNGNKTITFNYTKNAVSTPKYTVTVVHKDIKGKELAGATTATVEEGKSYTAKAVKVNGYTVMGDNSKTVTIYGNAILTFTYLKNDSDYYTITVKFVNETGQNIRPASKQLVEKGDSYVANAKEIPDYTVKGNNTQTISSVSKDETLTFVYTKNTAPVTKYTITVKYVDEAGSSIKTATTADVEKGNSYKIDAPAITGYTVVAADKTKSIASVSKNETLTIKYTKNKYTITIKYLDGNGTSIKTATTQTVEHGKAFSMNAPGITGYTVVPADKT
ncbi:MucBP domain-containing protein, partial [Enterococcus sp.]|uniref:MucBP domain-containing protein n=1 Tax=Enterococcus sp. TaxID=35783 RepID=UPI00290D6CBB